MWSEVEQLEAAGHGAEAADLAADFVSAPAAIVLIPEAVQAPGLSRRDIWHYAVIDETKIPREYLAVDHQKLGAVVRALKHAVAIPGVRVWREPTIAARAAR